MIQKIRYYCHKILPLVYDDSLSYYELLCKVVEKINEIIDNPTGIQMADPIEWNITSQYRVNTIVIDSNGTAYISKTAVPSGVELSNTDYWQVIFNYADAIENIKDQIGYNVNDANTTEQELKTGDIIFWNGKLYKVINDMTPGTQFIVDYNVAKYTVSNRFRDIQNNITDINEDITNIQTQIENLNPYFVTPEDYDAVGDGATDDSVAFQSAVNEAISTGKILLLEKVYYIHNITIDGDIHIYGGEVKAHLTEYNQTKNIFKCNTQCNITFENVKINGNANRRIDDTAELENMIRIENGKNVIFKDCEIYNHSQSDVNEDYAAWYLRKITAINCINCNYVIFDGCYIHNNHTEQIAIGSLSATTTAFIINNRSDNNTDGYGLFLLYNLKSGEICNNIFKNNKRTFMNVCSSNLSILNNRLSNSEGRGIASEAWAQAARLENNIIRNNFIENCQQGGIDSGIINCSVIGNTIKGCTQYGINFSGKITGNDQSVVPTSEIPWDENVLKDGKNILCCNNTIIDNSVGNRPAPFIIRSEINITNDVTTYGNIENITISNNTFKCLEGQSGAYSINLLNANLLKNIKINGNELKGFKSTGISLSYETRSLTNKIENLIITDNIFESDENVIIDYAITNRTCPKIENVIVKNNTSVYPVRRAFFVSALTASLCGGCLIKDNNIYACYDVLKSVQFHENNVSAFSATIYNVADINTIPQGLSVKVGDMLFRSSPDNNVQQLAIVSVEGTGGTLTGITASGSSASNIITVNNSSSLKIGDNIAILGSGVTRNKVMNIIDNTHVALTTIPTSTFTNASVTYFPPQLIKGLLMSP